MEKFVYLKSFILNDKGDLKENREIKTSIILVEYIPDFKENSFWINIKDIWILVGKIPPLTVEEGDLVLLKEKNKKWGMFRFLEDKYSFVVLQDVKGERKSKVKKEVLKKLNLFGKILRVQKRV